MNLPKKAPRGRRNYWTLNSYDKVNPKSVQFDWLFTVQSSPKQIAVTITYISHLLTHSLVHGPTRNIVQNPWLRCTFWHKNKNSKNGKKIGVWNRKFAPTQNTQTQVYYCFHGQFHVCICIKTLKHKTLIFYVYNLFSPRGWLLNRDSTESQRWVRNIFFFNEGYIFS